MLWLFYLDFKFNFNICNLVIFLGILSNLFLIFIYKKTQLSDRSAFIFLVIDILQLGVLLYLTGGVKNPFVIFLLIPSVFSSSNLSFNKVEGTLTFSKGVFPRGIQVSVVSE